MIKFGKIIIGLVLLVSLALVLSYCGSKSSDSGGTASAGAGASASSSAIQSATMGLSATAGSASAPSLRKAMSLSEAVNGLYSGLRAKRAEASALKAKFAAAAAPNSTPSMSTCTYGGNTTMDIATSGTTTTLTITYANCTEHATMVGMGTISQVLNGTLAFVDSGNSFTFSMGNSTTPYTDKITRLSDGAVLLDDVINMTFTGTADPASVIVTCSTGTEYKKFTIDMAGNMHLKGVDDTGVAYDETAVATAYKLVANSTLDSSTCVATGGTVAESGTLSYTDNLDSKGTESMDISAASPLTLTWTSVTTGTIGDTYIITGTFTMATSCFTGTLTLATPTAMFIPTSGDCPTAGVVTVAGDVNGTVVYTSTGGVQIKDNTGAVVETYPSCNEAQACR